MEYWNGSEKHTSSCCTPGLRERTQRRYSCYVQGRGNRFGHRYPAVTGSAAYRIAVDNSAGTGRGVRSVELDGQPLPNNTVPLSDDGKNHNVSVELG
jgi:hypothetical protein